MRAGMIGIIVAASVVLMAATATTQAAPKCFGKNPTIKGTDASETITGTDGNDVILARGGDDLVDGGPGDDRICGGPGDDDLDVGLSSVSANEGSDRLSGGTGEDFAFGGVHEGTRNTILGGDQADTLFSGGEDFMSGGDGKDHLRDLEDEDVLQGGDGQDEIFSSDGTRDEVNGGPERDVCEADEEDRLHSCVEGDVPLEGDLSQSQRDSQSERGPGYR